MKSYTFLLCTTQSWRAAAAVLMHSWRRCDPRGMNAQMHLKNPSSTPPVGLWFTDVTEAVTAAGLELQMSYDTESRTAS